MQIPLIIILVLAVFPGSCFSENNHSWLFEPADCSIFITNEQEDAGSGVPNFDFIGYTATLGTFRYCVGPIAVGTSIIRFNEPKLRYETYDKDVLDEQKRVCISATIKKENNSWFPIVISYSPCTEKDQIELYIRNSFWISETVNKNLVTWETIGNIDYGNGYSIDDNDIKRYSSFIDFGVKYKVNSGKFLPIRLIGGIKIYHYDKIEVKHAVIPDGSYTFKSISPTYYYLGISFSFYPIKSRSIKNYHPIFR